jgi:hypothetical protein
MNQNSRNHGPAVVVLCLLLPIPVGTVALLLNPEHEGMYVDLFIISGAIPISWSFAGVGCWVLGRIWNQDRTVCTFLRPPVEYWGLILFIVGFSLSVLGWWEMFKEGMFSWLPVR